MKRKILIVLGVVIILAGAFVGYVNFGKGRDGVAPKSLGPVAESEVERGKYLAMAADCAACHTKEGSEPFSGGAPLLTPFGQITGGNITPDKETGIGNWSDQDFLNAVKYGRAKGGKFLYPAMPYPNFSKASDKDILAIKAYLETVPAVRKEAPKNQLHFPFNIRPLVMGWNTLFFDKNGFQPDPAQSDEWNRGAYLVNGLGHCGMCHTPKNMFGADKSDQAFQGLVLQGWYAPELTSNSYSGIGGWSKDEIVEYLQSGSTKHAFATGPMAEVVNDSLQHLNKEDLGAIATYLKSHVGSQRKAPAATVKPDAIAMVTGERIFSAHCSACHGVSGEGTNRIAPSFADSSAIHTPNTVNLVKAILDGTRAVATDSKPTAPAMPSFRYVLSDGEVAAVLTYIRNSWGNHDGVVNEQDVTQHRKDIR